MVKEENNVINFEKWKEMMAKDIFVLDDEKLKTNDKLREMYFDDFDEEESSVSGSKKR